MRKLQLTRSYLTHHIKKYSTRDQSIGSTYIQVSGQSVLSNHVPVHNTLMEFILELETMTKDELLQLQLATRDNSVFAECVRVELAYRKNLLNSDFKGMFADYNRLDQLLKSSLNEELELIFFELEDVFVFTQMFGGWIPEPYDSLC